MRLIRERLTYRLVALIVLSIIAILWAQKQSIQVGQNTYDPEAVITLLGLIVGIIICFYPRFITLADKPIPVLGIKKAISEPVEKDPIKANRDELMKAVDQIWLSGLLDQLLNQQESLKIGLEALEPDKLAQHMGGQPYPLKDNLAVLQTFNDFGRKLVLLGEPGAGKTVLMLQLAKLLWNAAKRNERERIPMIFPLASWAAKQLPFEEWLQDEMHNRYGVPEKLAKALVESEQFIFLLDGLDEVAADYREACLKAIKAFVEDKNRHVEYVVCSRRKEFEALQTRLDIPGEIFLKPLRQDQINDYLKREPFAALRGLLNTDAIVRDQFAIVPFMLNTMAYVTRGESSESLRRLTTGKNTEESLRAAFLEEYVTQRLAEKPSQKYSNAKTRHWLRWLAAQLIKHDATDFYLENMQPDLLKSSVQQRGWRWTNGIFVWLLFEMIFGLGLWSQNPLGGLLSGMAFGLLFGFLFSIIDEIKMSDKLIWSRRRGQLLSGLMSGLLFGLLVGIFSGLLFGLRGGLSSGLQIGLWSGLLYGLAIGLPESLRVEINSQSLLRYRIYPGQGIQRSLKNGLVGGLLFGLQVGLLLGVPFGLVIEPLTKINSGLRTGLLFGLLGGLLSGLAVGLRAFIQHYTLRWMLAREGNLPFYRYDKFLDYANDLVILRKVGGGYRFTHDMLRQHLAAVSTLKADSEPE